MRQIIFLIVLAHAAPAFAAGFTFAGELRAEGTAFDGSVDLLLSLHASEDDDAPVWQEQQPGVVVVGGVFAVDVGSATPIAEDLLTGLSTAPLFLQIDVEGDALSPRVQLASVPFALRARLAELAAAANDALQFGGLAPDDYATLAALVEVGGATVSFENLTSVPADIADGDDGTLFSAGSGLQVDAAGVLLIPDGGLQAVHLAPDSVRTADLENGAISTAKIAAGAVTSAAIVNGSLTGAQLATDAVTNAKIAGANVFRVQFSACVEPVGSLVTATHCTRPTTCPTNEFFNCESNACEGCAEVFGSINCVFSENASCQNTLVGFLPQ